MASTEETVARIVAAGTWDQRVAQIRLVPQVHGTGDHARIFAEVARQAYVPHLAPDFAFVHQDPFYAPEHFQQAYAAAEAATQGFSRVDEGHLAGVIHREPKTLLVFRTLLGLTRDEFAQSTRLVAEEMACPPLTGSKVDTMERKGSRTGSDQARLAARTVCRVMDGTLFGPAPGGMRSKQAKPDTEQGWASVRGFASGGVPLALFLHQRHSGGAFRQVLDATSGQRGNLVEEAVEDLFRDHGIPFVRTGAGNQGDIAARFEVRVHPAPDFVVHDRSGTLRAMLECKVTNDGGTARDKALRFERLRRESVRLGGVPLVAVLGGTGWARVNDTLGPVIRDTDGRVFTLKNLPRMLEVAPFPTLIGLEPGPDSGEPEAGGRSRG